MRSSNGQAGSWGGLIIAGNGVTTEGVDATAEVGGILYGGTDNGDNSGSINFVLFCRCSYLLRLHFLVLLEPKATNDKKNSPPV